MVDFTLTPNQLEWQKKAREFAQNEILPVAWYFDEKDVMPVYLLKRAWEAGLMNLSVPKKYGGEELDNITQSLVALYSF